MIGSEEEPAGYGVAGAGVAGVVPGGVCAGRRSGLTSTHPAPPGWAGAMTVPSGDRAAQSVLRARHGRLMDDRELARGLATPSGSVTASPLGARVLGAGCDGLWCARRR